MYLDHQNKIDHITSTIVNKFKNSISCFKSVSDLFIDLQCKYFSNRWAVNIGNNAINPLGPKSIVQIVDDLRIATDNKSATLYTNSGDLSINANQHASSLLSKKFFRSSIDKASALSKGRMISLTIGNPIGSQDLYPIVDANREPPSCSLEHVQQAQYR
uniref:Uncharacterized protein n=1 Tax=Romanomermis culicivorax TaxID=13658 RepID=A0A915HRS3_ROMCU